MPCLQLPITRMPTKQSLVDTTRFALFIGTLSGGYNVLEAMFSALRNNRPNDTIPAIVAGGVVGTALLIDSESRRQPIALYTCANALHLVFVSMIKKGLVPDILPGGIPSYYVLLTCLCACWTLFACGFYPTSFFDSYKYFLIDFGKVPWVCATRPHTHRERERCGQSIPVTDQANGRTNSSIIASCTRNNNNALQQVKQQAMPRTESIKASAPSSIHVERVGRSTFTCGGAPSRRA
jgi:hypothetical protein